MLYKGSGTLWNRTVSEYLRPLFATPEQALDSVDRGRTAAGHHGKQTLRASGLDESQDKARRKRRGMNPVAIQSGLFGGYLNVLVEQIAHYSVMPHKGSRRSADPIDGYRQEASFLMTIV